MEGVVEMMIVSDLSIQINKLVFGSRVFMSVIVERLFKNL